MKKRIMAFAWALLMIITMIRPVQAASGTVSASVSSSSPVIGNKITLTITLKCSNGVGGGVIYLSYDSNYLKDPSLASTKYGKYENSTRKLVIDGSSASTVSFKFTFTTQKLGNTTIEVVTNGFIDYDGEDVTGYSENVKKKISIVGKSNNNTDNTTPLSKDNSLASLSIEGILLEQEFSGSQLEYTAYAPKGTTSLKIDARPSSSKAKIKDISNEVKEGWNTIDVVCISEDGTARTYKINVYVEETPTLYFGQGKLGVVKNLDKVSKPEGFEAKNVSINGENAEVLNRGNLNLIYLSDGNGNYDYYVLNEKMDEIIGLYEPIMINGREYLKTDFAYEDFADLDEEFDRVTVNINDILLKGWISKAENMSSYRLVYLMDDQGQARLYSYDRQEQTIQRYNVPVFPEPQQQLGFLDYLPYILTVISIAGMIFSLAIVASVKKRARHKSI